MLSILLAPLAWLRNLSYGAKTGAIIFLLSSGLTGAGGLIYYTSIRNTVLDQMGARLKDVGRTGAFLFTEEERAAIEQLSTEVNRRRAALSDADLKALREDPEKTLETLPPRDAEELMATPQFLNLVQRLRRIKEGSRRAVTPLRPIPQLPADRSDQPLVRFAYLLGAMRESPTFEHTYFLVDADFEAVDIDGDGTIVADEQGNAIGTVWFTPLEEFRQAFGGEAAAAREWYNDQWGTWLSAAVPIKAADGRVIAVLGLDYDIRGEANLLAYVRRVAIGLTGLGFLLSLLAAILISRLLGRRVKALSDGVERLRAHDFTVTLRDGSRDELGRLAGAFSDMVDEIRAYSQGLEAMNQAFERFVPREFLKELGHQTVLTVQPGDAVMKEMTVMFCDIRSFTSISERMTPAQNFQFLNEYLSRMSPIIRENNGFIDKYIGDALMALFPGGAADAIRAGSQMLIELSLFNAERRERNDAPLRIGIGIHHGSLMLGAVGEQERLDGTVISDAVNVASRLEQLTKRYRVFLLVSGEAMAHVRAIGAAPFSARFLGETRPRGREASIEIYEILDGLPSTEREQKLAAKERFEEALRLVQKRDYAAAHRIASELAAEFPLDLAAAAVKERLDRLIRR